MLIQNKGLRFSVIKLLVLTIVLSTVCAPLSFSVLAQGEVRYYVNALSGSDTNPGTQAANPLKTLSKAYALAEATRAECAVIVMTEPYQVPQSIYEPAHKVAFVITAEGNGALNFGKNLRYSLSGKTSFENIKITYGDTLNFTANYNPIVFGENMTLTNTVGSSGVYVVGGYQSPDDTVDVTKDSHITIKSGSFYAVCGGSRDKADGVNGSKYKICTFTGTHYIDMSGGEIDQLYGASLKTQYSQSAVITVSGGKILLLNIAGDLSRRLNGDGTATLSGGSISTVNVNNIIGTGTLNLRGTAVGKVVVSCYNDEVQKLETAANQPKILNYDANCYTEAQISAFSAGFDEVHNIAAVYTAAGATGSGKSAGDPCGFATGFAQAVQRDAELFVIGKLDLANFTEPLHNAKVTVRGADKNAILSVGSYTLSGDTVFGNITLSGNFDAKNGKFTAQGSLVTDENVTLHGNAALYGGIYKAVTEAQSVIIDGAYVESLVGGSGSAALEIISGRVGDITTTENSIESFSLAVDGGNIGTITFKNVTKSLSYSIFGGIVAAYKSAGGCITGTFRGGASYPLSSLGGAASIFSENGNSVYYLRDGGNGSGASFATAGGSLAAAYEALKKDGGTIVVCGKYTFSTDVTDKTHGGKITLTSVWDGNDYRETKGAAIIFKTSFYSGGETEFKDIKLCSASSYPSIFANNYKLTLGNGIENELVEGSTTHLSVMGGARTATNGQTSDVTIYSGRWQRVRGGAAAGGSQNYTVNLTVYGGEFVERVTLGSSASHNGNITAAIYGGTFYQGIYAATLTESDTFSGRVRLNVYGGTFYAIIGAAATTVGSYTGSFEVTLNGGEYAHMTDLVGTEGLKGNMTSSLICAFDANALETGTMTFSNPVRRDGADPWLFYHDGYYYYTATRSGAEVKLSKVANIGDLPYATGTAVYSPAANTPYGKGTWSPEIHYYTDEEIGAGNGGWYCYIASQGEETPAGEVNHRMYVIKCLDGDNLMGRWGNPITGEVNVPEKVAAPDIPDFETVWSAGMTDIRIGGKLYNLYVTEKGRGTADFYQTINIVEMTNPWTITGQSQVICEPEYAWEMEGYAYNAVTNSWSPKVVECGTAVYGTDGSVYIVYSGSNYTSTGYKLGQMKYLGGDPMNKSGWEKKPTSILSKSDEVNGCGSACYITDTSGQTWICYNAYLGKDSNGGRYAMVEPYTADKNGVVIGNGSTHPASPSTVYTVAVNPRPLAMKVSAFDSFADNALFTKIRGYYENFSDVSSSHWFYSFVATAYEYGFVNGMTANTFSPDGSFTVAQALTVAANIRAAYDGETLDGSGAVKWYTEYVEYCIKKGIVAANQFADYDANITRGDMAIIFAAVLPETAYAGIRDGAPADVPANVSCYAAVKKLYGAGIVTGDSESGNYRPDDSIKRSEACVIFTRLAGVTERK